MKPNSSNGVAPRQSRSLYPGTYPGVGLDWAPVAARAGCPPWPAPVSCHDGWPRPPPDPPNALGFGQPATLDPAFAAVSGVGAGFSPAQGRFGHGAVHTQPTPVQPLQLVIAFQSHSPQFQEHPSGNPFLKAQRAVDPEQMPWRPKADFQVRSPGPPPPKPMGVHTARGSGVPALPTARRRSGTRRWWDWSWWLGQHASDEAAWGLSL